MRAVILDVPDDDLRERHARGADRRDEMWEGVLHMVPPPAYKHQRILVGLVTILEPVARSVGKVLVPDPGVRDPAWAEKNYRVPDLAVLRDAQATAPDSPWLDAGVELLVEIRSPGDETEEKIPFYQARRIPELLIVERDSKAVTLRSLHGKAYRIVPPAPDGTAALRCLPVLFRSDPSGPVLVVLDSKTGRELGRI